MSRQRFFSVEELQAQAMRYLPGFLSRFLATGAGAGEGLRENVRAFRDYRFHARGLVDVDQVDTRRTIFGRTYDLPFGFAPIGNLGYIRPGAEEMLAEAAREANIPMLLSGCSNVPIERLACVAPDHLWFQLYPTRDPRIADDFVQRALDCGIDVLAVTVDLPARISSRALDRTPLSQSRGLDVTRLHQLAWDLITHPAWSIDVLMAGGPARMESWAPYVAPRAGANQIVKCYAGNSPAPFGWRELDRLRRRWPGHLMVKGLTRIEDVAAAKQAGVDAVAISNHGGHKLAAMAASIDILAGIAPRHTATMPLFFDGGIRSGVDILTAIALGAEFCFVGRAPLFGVAAAGRAGVDAAIDILRRDIAHGLAMLGAPTCADLDRSFLHGRAGDE